MSEELPYTNNACIHGISMDNACGACVPPRGTRITKPSCYTPDVQAAVDNGTASLLKRVYVAINPPDKGGINMREWNRRLKAVSADILSALENHK